MQISKMFQYSLITFILLLMWNCSKSQPVTRNSSEPFVIRDYRLISASLLLAIISVLYSCNNDSLENTTWKVCGDNDGISDVIVFNDKFSSVRDDTIFFKDSAMAVINKITFHYGERRLYVRELNETAIYRYCEQ